MTTVKDITVRSQPQIQYYTTTTCPSSLWLETSAPISRANDKVSIARLCLAAPHTAILLCTAVDFSVAVGLNTVDNILGELGVNGNVAVRNRLLRGSFSGQLVGTEVEADEQKKVAAQDTTTRESGELLTGALASIGDPGPVGGGEVGVGRKVDESYKNNKQQKRHVNAQKDTNQDQ